jgi:hypothetical protein
MAETSHSAEDPSRHQLFEAARGSAGWTVERLWIHYMALGGSLVVFDLDAYLAGLMPMPPAQQDVLACALNERLADLDQTIQVPYLTPLLDSPAEKDALTELLRQLHDLNSTD